MAYPYNEYAKPYLDYIRTEDTLAIPNSVNLYNPTAKELSIPNLPRELTEAVVKWLPMQDTLELTSEFYMLNLVTINDEWISLLKSCLKERVESRFCTDYIQASLSNRMIIKHIQTNMSYSSLLVHYLLYIKNETQLVDLLCKLNVDNSSSLYLSLAISRNFVVASSKLLNSSFSPLSAEQLALQAFTTFDVQSLLVLLHNLQVRMQDLDPHLMIRCAINGNNVRLIEYLIQVYDISDLAALNGDCKAEDIKGCVSYTQALMNVYDLTGDTKVLEEFGKWKGKFENLAQWEPEFATRLVEWLEQHGVNTRRIKIELVSGLVLACDVSTLENLPDSYFEVIGSTQCTGLIFRAMLNTALDNTGLKYVLSKKSPTLRYLVLSNFNYSTSTRSRAILDSVFSGLSLDPNVQLEDFQQFDDEDDE